MQNILIIGGGGREHALAWKAALSNDVDHVFVAPGNAGTTQENRVSNVDIDPLDFPALIEFAKQNNIALTIVGPEAPLAAGIVDSFEAAGLRCFGPRAQAAQLEASKSFCKDFMAGHDIPSAKYATFSNTEQALHYLNDQTLPIVIKASGLAAGKGVIIAQNKQEAEQAVTDMLDANRFGDAGTSIVIEEFLQGREISYIVIADGKNYVPLASSQDHKRRDDGNRGPNTGGMGAFSPARDLSDALEEKIQREIIAPTLRAMAEAGTPYVGFLYAGLMIDTNNEPKVLEFNCRLGDPETQPILFRLQSDLISLCVAALDQKLDQVDIKWDDRVALAVVMAAGGYPENYRKGDTISGLNYSQFENVKVFHAGTTVINDQIVTNGGRVLAVTALGNSLDDAKNNSYEATKKIQWPNCFYRNDIGSNI